MADFEQVKGEVRALEQRELGLKETSEHGFAKPFMDNVNIYRNMLGIIETAQKELARTDTAQAKEALGARLQKVFNELRVQLLPNPKEFFGQTDPKILDEARDEIYRIAQIAMEGKRAYQYDGRKQLERVATEDAAEWVKAINGDKDALASLEERYRENIAETQTEATKAEGERIFYDPHLAAIEARIKATEEAGR